MRTPFLSVVKTFKQMKNEFKVSISFEKRFQAFISSAVTRILTLGGGGGRATP
jgi:hypothetical protein